MREQPRVGPASGRAQPNSSCAQAKIPRLPLLRSTLNHACLSFPHFVLPTGPIGPSSRFGRDRPCRVCLAPSRLSLHSRTPHIFLSHTKSVPSLAFPLAKPPIPSFHFTDPRDNTLLFGRSLIRVLLLLFLFCTFYFCFFLMRVLCKAINALVYFTFENVEFDCGD